MRIVGGELSGRVFSGPGGDRTRPTSERVREGLFSALDARDAIDGARVLDAYAGTAALAFEALSRGASSALSVERDARNIKAIERDARALGLGARHRTLQLDLDRGLHRSGSDRLGTDRLGTDRLGREPFDLIFCDPPWADLVHASDVLEQLVATRLAATGLVVLVHAARDRHPDIAGLAIDADYRYGDTAAVIYTAGPSAASPPVEGAPDDAEAKAT